MSYKRLTSIPVSEGGTGATTLTGIVIGNGTSALTASTVTQHDVLVGGASNAVTSVAPSSTSGVPLISQGASADPAFGTAVVAGGGTGVTSTTAYAVLCGGTTSTGALQSIAGVGTSGQVLTSNGAGALPTFQAASGGGITTLAGNSGSATGSTVTISSSSPNVITLTGSGATLSVDSPLTVYDNINNDVYLGTTANGSTGGFSVGIGIGALGVATSDNRNVAIGFQALALSQGSAHNVVIGLNAAQNATAASNNVIIGSSTVFALTTGARNVVLGYAGAVAATATDNIVIGAGASAGSASNALVIGTGTGTSSGNLNSAFISGIQGITVTGTAVLVSSSDQLGVAVSSRRFKENIQPMFDYSEDIYKLRPVTFTYIEDEDKTIQGGLIAEEVADVMPQLVVNDKEGLPQTVKYHDLPALLLNEIQKLKKQVDFLMSQITVPGSAQATPGLRKDR